MEISSAVKTSVLAMKNERTKDGFSLTEVLISIGILSVGMLFIAGVFPVALHFTNITSERTFAAVIADQAFAKIQLYARGKPNDKTDNIRLGQLKPYSQRSVWLQSTNSIDPNDYEDDILPAISDEFRTVPIPITDPYLQYNRCEFMRTEMTYPSDDAVPIEEREYYWSPLFRRLSKREGPDDPNRLVQVTVFVCRRKAPNLRYFLPVPFPTLMRDPLTHGRIDWRQPATRYWPQPVKISVIRPPTLPLPPFPPNDKLWIYIPPEDETDKRTITLINEGSIIVDDRTGQRYRVIERYKDDPQTPLLREDAIILLDRPWQGRLTVSVFDLEPASVWVIPPPVRGGKSPCIGVYQRVIRF
ncbi:prepilin-type N-terminal cleavage/methylation domain-containing protein [Planctomycetota bacterium]